MLVSRSHQEPCVGLLVIIEPRLHMRFISSNTAAVSYVTSTGRLDSGGGRASTQGGFMTAAYKSDGNGVALAGTCNQPVWKNFMQKLLIRKKTNFKHEISGDPAVYVITKTTGTLITLDGHVDNTFKVVNTMTITQGQPPIDYLVEDHVERCDEWLESTASYATTVRTMMPISSRTKYKH